MSNELMNLIFTVLCPVIDVQKKFAKTKLDKIK